MTDGVTETPRGRWSPMDDLVNPGMGQPAPAVRVKPLVWVGISGDYERADSALGRYEVAWGFASGQACLMTPDRKLQWFDTLEAAKAAAQADYEARIMAAIEHAPGADVAALVEAGNYLSRVVDFLLSESDYRGNDVLLPVKQGSNVHSVGSARAALAACEGR